MKYKIYLTEIDEDEKIAGPNIIVKSDWEVAERILEEGIEAGEIPLTAKIIGYLVDELETDDGNKDNVR